MRRNMKPQWGEEKVIDLWETADSSLLGDIGEVIAKKYLWTQHMIVHSFWRWQVLSHYLNKNQIHFLESCSSSTRRSRVYDLVGVRPMENQPYLVEVKATRSNRYRYDRRKLPNTEQRLKAKSLGFKLLLVIVQLVDNWKFVVASRELR